MSDTIPDYIAARIRQISPAMAPVVPGSTPVVSFGDVRHARVATLGLNPSKREFCDAGGRMLLDDQRRLETLDSLGHADLASAPAHVVERIFEGCNRYFSRRPYHWFNKLERVLQHANASYRDGSACHLDLVQSATDPVWRDLSGPERLKLLEADLPFLRRQLSKERLGLLLLNGKRIVKACEDWLGVPLSLHEQRQGRVRLFTGRGPTGTIVIGWNINLQSGFGVSNDEVDYIGTSVRRLFQEMVRPEAPTLKTPTAAQLERVLRHLPSFSNADTPVPSSEISALISELYKGGFVVEFDWPDWQQSAADFVDNPHRLEQASLDDLQKLLTTHVRKERFSEGHFDEMVRSGHIRQILKRLSELRR